MGCPAGRDRHAHADAHSAPGCPATRCTFASRRSRRPRLLTPGGQPAAGAATASSRDPVRTFLRAAVGRPGCIPPESGSGSGTRSPRRRHTGSAGPAGAAGPPRSHKQSMPIAPTGHILPRQSPIPRRLWWQRRHSTGSVRLPGPGCREPAGPGASVWRVTRRCVAEGPNSRPTPTRGRYSSGPTVHARDGPRRDPRRQGQLTSSLTIAVWSASGRWRVPG